MAAENENNNKIPAPLYAVAAVGNIAYQRLRKLPDAVTELRGRVAAGEVDRLRGDAAERVLKLRDAAQRNVATLMTGAQTAQERAQALYADLVAKGEQVVRGRRIIHATVGKPEAPAEAETPAVSGVQPTVAAEPKAGAVAPEAPAEPVADTPVADTPVAEAPVERPADAPAEKPAD